MAEAAPHHPEPRWIAEAVRAATHEAILYLKTAWAFTAGPRRFARAWVEGAIAALNPLAFLATSAAVMGTSTQIVARVLDRGDEPAPLWRELLLALTPYLYYVALGLVAHVLLRVTGAVRKLTSTVAMALYAGGGPATLAMLVLQLLQAALRPPPGSFIQGVAPQYKIISSIAIFGSFLIFPVTFAAALAALHGASRRRTAFSVISALCLLGLLLGWLGRPSAPGQPARFKLGMVHMRVPVQRGIPFPDLYW